MCAVVVPRFVATATVVEDDAVGSDSTLVTATVRRFVALFGSDKHRSVTISSSIPRSVGLAGSSAIVIAVIRALAGSGEVDMTDDEVAAMAYAVERDDLGIAGGWQDQVIQARDSSGFMDFSAGRRTHRRLSIVEDPPIPLYVAWSGDLAESSGIAHRELRTSGSMSSDVVEDLAALARRAAAALEQRNIHELKAAIDATFHARSQNMRLAPQHRALVEEAQAHGASANFAGSGGAVVGVLPKDGNGFVAAMQGRGINVTTWFAQ